MIPPCDKINKRPPLGVMPREIWETNRIQELSRAIYMYSNYKVSPVMLEWIEELKELVNKYKE